MMLWVPCGFLLVEIQPFRILKSSLPLLTRS